MTKNDNSRACAILSYLIVGIIWWIVDDKMRKNAFAKFHAKQAIILFVACIILSVISTFVEVIAIIPILGWIIGLVWVIIYFVASIALFILWIIGIINAASEKKKELPIIGSFAKMLTF